MKRPRCGRWLTAATFVFFFAAAAAAVAESHSSMSSRAFALSPSSPSPASTAAPSEARAAVRAASALSRAAACLDFAPSAFFRAASSETKSERSGFVVQPPGFAISRRAAAAVSPLLALIVRFAAMASCRATDLNAGTRSASASIVSFASAIFSRIPSGGLGRWITSPAASRSAPSQMAQ
jgi:hypothetical protein